jgi:serine phosphatase RsbU (regulator of sigma subunit)
MALSSIVSPVVPPVVFRGSRRQSGQQEVFKLNLSSCISISVGFLFGVSVSLNEVASLILPKARMTLPGLVIESEYLPALEVGGDLFQIIPHPTDSSLLIVAGDVTGKGLKAGMTMALLVGAIRTAAEISAEPKFVLEVSRCTLQKLAANAVQFAPNPRTSFCH